MSKYGLDKFYTKESVVDEVLKTIDLYKYNTIIEPSAGNGSFSKKLDCFAYDIEPGDETIIKQDFLTLKVEAKKPTLVIGNPPFGRNGSLAFSFIKHACSFADTIAFILPKSFKKDSFYHRVPLEFWKVLEMDIEENSFIYEGKEMNIPCVFQIYERRSIKRIIKKEMESIHFDFVKKGEANVSIRRVGAYAGKAYLDLDKSEQSHYFIKTENQEDFVEKVNKIKWEHNNTVGPRSVSKPELVMEVNKLFDNNK